MISVLHRRLNPPSEDDVSCSEPSVSLSQLNSMRGLITVLSLPSTDIADLAALGRTVY